MTNLYEAEIADGLADVVSKELKSLLGTEGKIRRQHRFSEIPFTYNGDPRQLLQLQTALSVYAVLRFPVPRPKALLGHQVFHEIIEAIHGIMNLQDENTFRSLCISAAGSESSVMLRLKNEFATSLNLEIEHDEGDLFLRIRPTPQARDSWDVLVRLSPRPLATRTWRVCNMAGALNASVANAMIRLTNPTPQDTFLNIGCGSGTILIERLAVGSAKCVIGCDINLDTLRCSEQNVDTSGAHGIQLLHSDGANLPLPEAYIDALCADLPFGQLVGSHQENEWLYPAIMGEAARVARSGARFVVITHEVRLMENTLDSLSVWQVRWEQMITLSGIHPRIYVLERRKR